MMRKASASTSSASQPLEPATRRPWSVASWSHSAASQAHSPGDTMHPGSSSMTSPFGSLYSRLPKRQNTIFFTTYDSLRSPVLFATLPGTMMASRDPPEARGSASWMASCTHRFFMEAPTVGRYSLKNGCLCITGRCCAWSSSSFRRMGRPSRLVTWASLSRRTFTFRLLRTKCHTRLARSWWMLFSRKYRRILVSCSVLVALMLRM
mmetsp:Transcript_93404/g.246935  ORF Transcript_93404/g.246935 Transcript_93404/m.246935 type:complete len:207 (-) Transcript_93404:1424-2044(-)